MVKSVTCGLQTIYKAAKEQGILLSYGTAERPLDGCEPDVVCSCIGTNEGAVAVRGVSLAGDLFLSLLVAGAIG